jgi:hypothetical protein
MGLLERNGGAATKARDYSMHKMRQGSDLRRHYSSTDPTFGEERSAELSRAECYRLDDMAISRRDECSTKHVWKEG